MINLLIVDDEDFAIKFLLDVIDFTSFGIDNVFVANDSQTALDIARQNKIDILMTDISMPNMDGIALSTELKDISPECCIIFMSGFSEKEYYKSAINLGVTGFIDKPFDIDEIREVIAKTVNKINSQNNSDTPYEDIAKIIQKDLIIDMTRKITNYEAFSKKMHSCNLSVLESSYVVTGLIRFISKNNDDNYSILSVETEKNVLDIPKQIDGLNVIYTFKQDNLLLIHLFACNSSVLNMHNLTYAHNLLTKNLMERYNLLSAFGHTVYSVSEAYSSYQKAVINLEAGFVVGYNKIISHIDESEPYTFDADFTKDVLQALREQNKSKVLNIINDVLKKILLHPLTPAIKIKTQFIYLLNKLNDETFFRIETSEKKTYHLMQQSILINNCNSIQEIQSILYNYIDSVFDIYTSEYSTPVKKVLTYIHDNYTNSSMTLKDISNHALLNASYMCTVFKKETGKTINQYLTEYRMTKTQELLVNTNKTIEAIAKAVGYNDSKNFFKTFKKQIGTTPANYRKKFTV